MPIVWTKPDGSVVLMYLSPRFLREQQREGEMTAEAVARLASGEQAKNQELVTATMALVKTADVPVERSQRHKWRLQGDRVVVDAAVPNLPKTARQLKREAVLADPAIPQTLKEYLSLL